MAQDPDAPFAADEVARFRRLKAVADAEERTERYQTMISRQLDRLEVELSDEQRKQVIDLTLAFRDRVRQVIRDPPRDASREERLAILEAVRAPYAEAVRAVVPAADAERILESLGRNPGFALLGPLGVGSAA